MVELADKNNLEIVLAYYPLYLSKYNPIERTWGILENHWSAILLNSVTTTLEWAKIMTWKGLHPIVGLLETTYPKGVKVGKKMFEAVAERINRHCLFAKILYDYTASKGMKYFGGSFIARYLSRCLEQLCAS